MLRILIGDLALRWIVTMLFGVGIATYVPGHRLVYQPSAGLPSQCECRSTVCAGTLSDVAAEAA